MPTVNNHSLDTKVGGVLTEGKSAANADPVRAAAARAPVHNGRIFKAASHEFESDLLN
jgi:hypothetical protein